METGLYHFWGYCPHGKSEIISRDHPQCFSQSRPGHMAWRVMYCFPFFNWNIWLTKLVWVSFLLLFSLASNNFPVAYPPEVLSLTSISSHIIFRLADFMEDQGGSLKVYNLGGSNLGRGTGRSLSFCILRDSTIKISDLSKPASNINNLCGNHQSVRSTMGWKGGREFPGWWAIGLTPGVQRE